MTADGADPAASLAAARRAMALQAEGRIGEALAEVERARAPHDIALETLRAAFLAQSPDVAQAVDAYAALVARQPAEPRLWLSYGHALKSLGRRDHAVAAYREALARRPVFGEAYWSLANLKVFRFEPADILTMTGLVARRDLGEDDRAYLHFALGKALEDEGRFDEAFGHYQAGNRLRRAAQPYSADDHHRFASRTQAVFKAIAQRCAPPPPAGGPIFIVGLPRSGSTLLEQMLGAHSAVEGLSELPILPALASALARSSGGLAAYPDSLLHMAPDALAALGRAYLARASQHRRTRRPFFIDKLPGNAQHLALIQLALPDSRIVEVRRGAMDCCLSLYKQCFAGGQGYSYDLSDLGRYYSDHVEMMDAFSHASPGRMLCIRYEDLVTEPEAVLRQVLGYCGLAYEAGCLDPARRNRVVRTPSAEQVRAPLSTAGFGAWRNFAAHLAPLREALAPPLRP